MPERLAYQSENHESTKYGEALTIVSAPFGKPVNNEELLALALDLGLPVKEMENARHAITATGFTNRFSSNPPEEEPNTDLAIKGSIENGAKLLTEIMKSHGWTDGIDVFIDTSAFLPNSINKEILALAGLNPDHVVSKSYRYACAGAVGAFIDCLSDPALKNTRIVIAALEPLSYVIDKSHFHSPKSISIPAIFGDANTLIAFTPNRFHLDVKQILIQPDHGVIKLNTLYDFGQMPSNPASTPSHYRFGEGGESIFRYSESGAYLKIESPGQGASLSMDGMATGFFFGDQTASVITDLILEHGDTDILRKLNGKNIIMHSASKPVVDRIAKLLRRSEHRFLDTPELPFLMDKARQSNGSSATTLNRWQYMIKNNMMDADLPMLWIAPGIGSAIAGAIGTINP
ncbi:MAG: hypothetical protein HYV90_00780 [Candidatus Woesebacteria bacterium]|nr:MAG: hypothetical protein HYV90_00780 [Candidatus Woesebacteria bacterium]